ncbi:hypothetical protein [Streptomyces sp. SLBN-134]|uniref:hypothetical protein n=1 Tax=Streptomyces sp. SLBN-134 TaxID=2768456 RepID=UPI0011520D78|nr:hypothetical protein [Streptomyces sp. SLBN-134]
MKWTSTYQDPLLGHARALGLTFHPGQQANDENGVMESIRVDDPPDSTARAALAVALALVAFAKSRWMPVPYVEAEQGHDGRGVAWAGEVQQGGFGGESAS